MYVEGKEDQGSRAGAQTGSDTVRGLQGEDDGVALSFRLTGMSQPAEEVPLVPLGHKCGESARRIRLTVHRLPPSRVWYLFLVQAYLEQGRGKGERAWCRGVLVTKGWKARTDNKCEVYSGVKGR